MARRQRQADSHASPESRFASSSPWSRPHLQVTLISPNIPWTIWFTCGLLNRPELASQKALVQATLELLRQERLRPLLPSLVLAGCGPDGTVIGGTYGGGTDGRLSTWGGRAEFDAGLVWTLQNLGAGNRALVRGREADRKKALIELLGPPRPRGRRSGPSLRAGRRDEGGNR